MKMPFFSSIYRRNVLLLDKGNYADSKFLSAGGYEMYKRMEGLL